MLPLFCCRDLDLGSMTLKLNCDLDKLKKMYLQTGNSIYISGFLKSTKIAIKAKDQGHMPPPSKHF